MAEQKTWLLAKNRQLRHSQNHRGGVEGITHLVPAKLQSCYGGNPTAALNSWPRTGIRTLKDAAKTPSSSEEIPRRWSPMFFFFFVWFWIQKRLRSFTCWKTFALFSVVLKSHLSFGVIGLDLESQAGLSTLKTTPVKQEFQQESVLRKGKLCGNLENMISQR